MSTHHAQCAICGDELLYFEQAQPVTCELCGKEETGHSLCVNHHYVCDACHRTNGIEHIIETCLASKTTNPIALAEKIMGDQSIYQNGPEHHTLVGAVLLAAYKHAGGDIDLAPALEELRSRSMQVPGGTCGFWGCCGAAISAGQFFSIITNSTPLSRDPWAQTARLTSRIMGRLADIGGPRCCKRTSFVALEESIVYVDEVLGTHMDKPERTTCTFVGNNAECLRKDCPFFSESA